jgi:hypothetical protein
MAILLVAPGTSFALWEIEPISKERAKELGMKIRSTRVGSDQVRVELEFKAEGELKTFAEGALDGDRSRVELRIGKRDRPAVTAPLLLDRSKPGCVVVGLTADRNQLDELTLWVFVPGTLGGEIFELRLGDFAEISPQASGIIDAKPIEFPDEGMAIGLKGALALLESCRDESRYEAAERLQAERGDHVRLVLSTPLSARVLGEQIEFSELVFRLPMNTGVFWVRSGDNWRRYSKYEPQKEKPFKAWLGQAQPAD